MFWRRAFILFLLLPVSGLSTNATAQAREIVLAQAASKAQVKRAKMGVQIALKVLGFDPGSVDGKIGGKTRNAIRAYQRSIGAKATGVLSEAQVLQVLADAKARVIKRAAAQKAASQQKAKTQPLQATDDRPTFKVFNNTDMPGHDYRTPRTEPGLKGIGFKRCGKACADDPVCRAFTYNQKAGWCFLKSAAGKLNSFRGAVSGVKEEAKAQVKAQAPAPVDASPPGWSPAPKSQDFARTCHTRREGEQIIAPNVSVSSSAGQRESIRPGDALDLRWSVKSKIDSECKNPLYLVFSTPKRVRFAGEGFFALAPGAKGPFGLTHDIDKTRVFVPLHIGDIARSGIVQVKFYEAGSFDITPKLIEVPRLKQYPTARDDFSGAEPVITALGDGAPVRVDVQAGAPHVVVQDRATITAPKSKIYANSGEFVLETFDGYYRVLDAKSGELIIQRDGTEPNFSPTARFVHALRENRAKLEIVDLYARVVAHEFGNAGGGIGVNTIAWGHADSFVTIAPAVGGGDFLNILTDRKPTSVSPSTYKISLSRTVEMHLDMEQLTLATKRMGLGDLGLVYYSLLESQREGAGYIDRDGRTVPDPRYQRRYGFFRTTWPQFSGKTLRWKLGDDMQIDYASLCALCASRRGITDLSILRKKLQSENPIQLKGRELRQWVADSIKEAERLLPLFVRHSTRRPEPKRVASFQSSTSSKVRSVQWRGITRVQSSAPASEAKRALTRIQEFADFDLSGNHRATVAGAINRFEGWDGARRKSIMIEDGRDRELERAVSRHLNLPRFRPTLEKWTSKRGTQYDDPGQYGCEAGSPEIGNIVSLSRVVGRTAWRVGDDRYWLVQQDCVAGMGIGIVEGQLGLMIQRSDKAPEFIPFRGNLGIDGQGLAKAWMTEDEILIVATPNRMLFLYDIRRKKQIASIVNAPEADIALDIRISRDRTKLLQINTNGSVFVYSVKTGEKLLNGYYLDDEIVFYRNDGSFIATPEGAHLVYLKFPGVAGYHSFHQFEKQLRVPGLVEKVLTGEAVARHDVAVPPLLTATIDNASGNRVTGTFTARSSGRLARIQVYQDGVLSDTISPVENGKEIAFDVARLAGTRWISLLAIDETGLASQPLGRDLGPDPRGRSRVVSLSIGIDLYKDPSFNLNGAASDARTVARALERLKSKTRGLERVNSNGPVPDPVTLLNEAATRSGILAAFEAVIAEARVGDTLIVSYAGHGVKDADGVFYLSTHETRLDDLPGTAIAWREISAILSRSKARVILLLDACHSGAVGTDFFATNDQAASELLAGVPSNIVVFAASKGREFSFEAPGGKGGVFSRAFAAVIDSERRAHDLDNNGAIEISELFIGVKRKVVVGGRAVRENYARVNGVDKDAVTQTPWIARNRMVGDFSLF